MYHIIALFANNYGGDIIADPTMTIAFKMLFPHSH